MNMGNTRTDTAKLACKKSRAQVCTEQPFCGSWAPASSISASSLGARTHLQGCRKRWVVLRGNYTQPDVFLDRPLPDMC